MVKTDKKSEFIEAYIRKMGNISSACEEIGIDRKTYYRWLKQDKFKQMFNNAIEHHNDLIYSRIFKKALEEDKDMLKFWAETQMKHRGFVKKQETEISTGQGGFNINLQQLWEECKDEDRTDTQESS